MTYSQVKDFKLPKIVDRKQKRKDIALSSTELFCQKGFNNLTVSEVAKNANVAKGTIYEYFKNKEDIIFAIIEYAYESYDKEVLENIYKSTSVKEKILALFSMCIENNNLNSQRRQMYKEFMLIYLSHPNDEIIQFQQSIRLKYTNWLTTILQEAIDSKQLKPEAINFTNSLYTMGESVLLLSQNDILSSYIDSLYDLLKTGE